MEKRLFELLFELRAKYGAIIRKTPKGGFVMALGNEKLRDIAIWLLEQCDCRIVDYDDLKVIFVEKNNVKV